ncbi:MAG: DUF899 family protein [Myxococcales bacterium]|nr:DUF899 family protein [Myxococcales bacterium]
MPDQPDIVALEKQIFELTAKLNELRAAAEPEPVGDYRFSTLSGAVQLRDLFAGKDRLLVVHNMGQACRYCTLWADGFNGLLPHLESAMAVVVASGDPPEVQRRFASSRGWRFRMVSHEGTPYAEAESVGSSPGYPGAVVYERRGDQVLRKSTAVFGPGDLYCSLYALLGLAGIEGGSFTPQYRYWSRPEKMLDGGDNVLD